MRYKHQIYTLFLLLFSQNFTWAQQKIEVEDFTEKHLFWPQGLRGLNWLKDGTQYSTLEQNSIVAYNVITGQKSSVLLDVDALDQRLQIQTYVFSEDEQKILLLTQRENIYRYSYTAIYYIYDRVTKRLSSLGQGRQSYATFSPDGSKVAYVQANNLYYYDLITEKTVQITEDGLLNEIINGSTDWVYEEELMLTKAFFWSPDSKRLAYYRFDERHVKEFTMHIWQTNILYPYAYRFKYPKAGEENAKVEVYIYDLKSKQHLKVDLGDESDFYLPRMQWTRDADLLSIERLNRLQNQRDILHVDARTAKSQVILREISNTYIDLDFCDDLYYLKDGTHFLYSSEESGFKHFYLYTLQGKKVRALTQGKWEATKFVALDENAKPMLYYLSTEGDAQERHFYKIDLKAKHKVRLSKQSGVHSVQMSRDLSYYINTYSSPEQPPLTRLYRTKDHTLVKILRDNESLLQQTKAYGFVQKEFFSFPTKGSQVLSAYLLKPKNFDSSKSYPLLIYQYSGPGVQLVQQAWGGGNYAWHQMLTQKGYIIAVVDTRGTGARGETFKKATYAQMGRLEVEDLAETAKYFATLPYIDANRMGIWGWSYGGYMSSLALFLYPEYFKLAIAVAPVTSWRFYDTIYTERYLKRPQENAEGYDNYSPLSHVKGLKGKYLLIHGTADDNVHFQHSIALQEALIRAGKHFSSFYYPGEAHSLRSVRTHLYKMMTQFIENNL